MGSGKSEMAEVKGAKVGSVNTEIPEVGSVILK